MEHKFLMRYLLLLAVLLVLAFVVWGLRELSEEPSQDAVLVYEYRMNDDPVLINGRL